MADPTRALDPNTPPVRFRQTQQAILNYKNGLMGIAAVPGAGKTFTLAHLAAKLIGLLSKRKDADQTEVLIVTLTNTAVNSFKSRLTGTLNQQRLLLPYSGYRIRTLHGLASDILRERPALAGLPDNFVIIDEREAAAIRRDAVARWWVANSDWFLEAFVAEKNREKLRKDPDMMGKLRDYAADHLADRFIALAKDREQTPEELRAELINGGLDVPLARFGLEIYEVYQKALTARGGVDFGDLSRRALQAIRTERAFLKRLQKRWPFILEDEAQDSSKLQEEMLRLLSDGKNWVRVGDPNQSINSTFTTADPHFLKAFLNEEKVIKHALDEAGRSARPIIDLANELVRWSVADHPAEELRTALTYQRIMPTLPGDPIPNPPGSPKSIFVDYEKGGEISSDGEIKRVISSVARWLPDHPNDTVAILVPDNERGFRMVEALRERGIIFEELLSSTTGTRAAADQLYTVLAYLARPLGQSRSAAIKLSGLYQKVWWPLHLGRIDETPEDWTKAAVNALDTIENPEAFLWPELIGDTEANAAMPVYATLSVTAPELAEDVRTFAGRLRRWLDALILPVDQLVLIVNQDLFTEPADIALGYKFAGALRSASYRNPHWRLDEFVAELRAISTNERKYFGLETLDRGYMPQPGRVTVATMHQAKGLEWDRVYVTGVSNYVFPSLQPYDNYQDERWEIRDDLNLKAEIAAQLHSLIDHRGYTEGDATYQARIDFSAERLRLLYVAITRARKDLLITWNTGRFAERNPNRPALPLVALHNAAPLPVPAASQRG